MIIRITLDYERSSTVLIRSNGQEACFPLEPSSLTNTSALSRVHYMPAFNHLVAVTRAGDDITFELPEPGGDEHVASRLVVYLDQNQWSVIAKAIHDPGRVNDEDRLAARRLAEWARQRRIVLPASSGHYYETTKQFDAAERYRLGLTILRLSRGWQLRDPVQVRRDEFLDMFRRRFVESPETQIATVFTLNPNVIHGPWRGGEPYVAPSDFTPGAAFRHEALTSALALMDIMLDSERIEPGPIADWATANQRFSDWLDGENRDSQQKRRSVDAFLLSDLWTETAQEAHAAGMTREQHRHWLLHQAAEDIQELPATGLFREMMHERHLNKGTVWKPNDLIDMVYLSCGAGYADFVVCENHMRGVLKQGLKRLGRPQRAFRRLRDAAPVIEAALAAPTR